MKKVLIAVLPIVVATSALSQPINRSKHLQQGIYLQQSSYQKTTAWSLLGGGALLNVISIATYPKTGFSYSGGNGSSSKSNVTTSTVLIVVGSAAMIASIPYFIASGANRRKAMEISVAAQQGQKIYHSNMITSMYPAVTMKLRL